MLALSSLHSHTQSQRRNPFTQTCTCKCGPENPAVGWLTLAFLQDIIVIKI